MAITKIVDEMRTTTALDAAKVTTGTLPEARIASLDATKLTGTIAVGRLGNAPATDLTPVKNDISLLALQTAINGNMSAYGLKNSWIEQFENSTYIENLSDCTRDASEYISSIGTSVGPFTNDANTKLLLHMEDASLSDSSSTGHITTITGNAVRSSTQARFGTYSVHMTAGNITLPAHADFNFGTGDFTIEGWVYYNATIRNNEPFFDSGAWGSNNFDYVIRMNANAGTIFEYGLYNGSSDRYKRETTAGAFPVGSWQHIAVSRTSGATTLWRNGLAVTQAVHQGFVGNENMTNGSSVPRLGSNTWLSANAYFDEFRISNVGRYTAPFTPNEVESVSATGSFESTDVVPQDTTNKSSVGLVLLYKDNGSSSCNLNTDIVAQVRANTGQAYDSGSNTLALVGAGTYSDSLKIAIAPAISVTAGQALSYKISFANQASGTKEARIYGVALTY